MKIYFKTREKARAFRSAYKGKCATRLQSEADNRSNSYGAWSVVLIEQ